MKGLTMKKYFLMALWLLAICSHAQEIQWLNLEQAEKALKKTPEKPFFIDFYTDWCGWCKKMDQSTFLEKEVVDYIHANYIPIKFNAESKEEVRFMGKSYRFVKAQGGSRGVNSFAYFSLRGQMSYPAYAVIASDGKLDRLLLGFMNKERLISGLKEARK